MINFDRAARSGIDAQSINLEELPFDPYTYPHIVAVSCQILMNGGDERRQKIRQK